MLDPERSQALNMSFMKSTVRIDDNKYDIFEITDEWQDEFFELGKTWSYSTIRAEGEEYLSIYFVADN